MNHPEIPARPKRQVHLDFHTSPLMPGVGSRFDKKQFQDALKAGHINSITVFAKCHHGLCYYPTKVGVQHPTLDFDLTGAMIDAAHEIGVRCPVYITAGWSHGDAVDHPEWTARKKDGSISGSYNFYASEDTPKPNCCWIDMCLNDGSYCKHIYDITEEVAGRYKELDGLFYDIVFVRGPCYCDECVKGMRAEGLDPTNDADAWTYYRKKHIAFMEKCAKILHKHHPDATIFFNSGGADPYQPEYHPYSTHFEMEDLPTAWGGYNKMPLNAKFFSRTGKHFLGMTGKFHLDWGEFGGFKTKEALRYEVSTMALYGAACSVGDQMYPDGLMDEQTYENIGYAYSYLEQIEPYCYGGLSTAKLGVFMSPDRDENSGISDILIENQIDFELLTDASFADYEAVILPAGIHLDDTQVSALKAYLASGGKVLAVGNSIVRDGKFLLDCGLENPRASEMPSDYIQIGNGLSEELPRTPFLCYQAAMHADKVDAEVYAEVMDSFFARTYGHFCSHRNTPYDKNGVRYPAMAKKGNLVWLAHDIPVIYKRVGSIFHRRFFLSALALIFDNPCKVRLFSEGRCRLIRQPEENRYCLNMTYASPCKRGEAEIIDEILPLYDIPAEIRIDEDIKVVRTVTGGETLPFTKENGVVRFTIPKLQCHECVVLEY